MLGPLLEVEMSKKCTPLWREAHFHVKMLKTQHARTTFGSWDVEKVHAVVARSTFPRENVKNTTCSDHFWKLRCRKSARRCGAKHISKSKRPSLTTFWRSDVEQVHAVVARSTFPSQHVQKTPNVRTTFDSWDVVLRGRRKGLWTLPRVSKTCGLCSSFSYNHQNATLHYPHHHTTLHYTALNFKLHYITLHNATLHYPTPHHATLHYNTLHYTTIHYAPLHPTTLHSTTLHSPPLHSPPPHSTTLNYTTLHPTTQHPTTLHDTTIHYTQLHYVTLRLQLQPKLQLRYCAVHCTRLHYMAPPLHYITPEPLHLYNLTANTLCTLITLHHSYNSTTL